MHNRYRSDSPSGENAVVDQEVEAMRARGVVIETYFRCSDEIEDFSVPQKLLLATSPVTGWSSRRTLRAVLDRFKPDVMHLHNPYPLISPWVLGEAKARGIRTVVTVHNFRIRCMNGLFFRDGAICLDCEETAAPWSGVRHACYRNSRGQSAVMAVALTRNRPRWTEVDRFIALSPFVCDRLVSWGVARDRIVVKPNAVAAPSFVAEPGSGFLYVGRLSVEKGILELLSAWDASRLGAANRLQIVGSGPLETEVRAKAQSSQGVELLGPRTPEEVAALRASTAVSVVPSVWFEVNPLVVLESFGAGRPVVATRSGSLEGLVDDEVGWLAAPRTADLADSLVSASSLSAIAARAVASRERYERLYAPDVVHAALLATYESLIV